MPSAPARRTAPGRVVAAAGVAVALALGLIGPPARAQPTQQDVGNAEERLQALERDFQLAVEGYNAANERLEELQAQVEAGREEVGRIEAGMAGSRSAATALARELYRGAATAELEALLSAEGLEEVHARIGYLQVSRRGQTAVFQRFAASRTMLNRELTALVTARTQAEATESQLRDLRATIEAKVAGQRDELDRLRAQVARAERERLQREQAAARARAAEQAARQVAEEAAPRVAREAPAAPAAPAPRTQAAPAAVRSAAGARSAPAPSARAQTAVDAALSQVGKPYRWGGAGPDAYDCSGLTQWAWARAGVSLPHNSRMQYQATARVDRGGWQPGDLLFFGNPIHHVGLYIGDGQMVEAPYSGTHVRVRSAYRSDYVGAGRPD